MSNDENAGFEDKATRLHWADDEQVRRWAKRLGVDREVLIGALKAVGPDIAAVKRFLGIG